jgi:hypothetical protein
MKDRKQPVGWRRGLSVLPAVAVALLPRFT